MKTARIFRALGMLLLAVTGSSLQAEDKLKALIIDGQNNHDWKATTPVLKWIMEDCGRFTVDVSTTPPSAPIAPRSPKGATPQQQAAHAAALAKWKTEKAGIEQANANAWKQWRPKFGNYDVIVMNYTGDRWPDEVRAGFVQYVRAGGGLVIFHAANNAFPDWPEFNEMIGVGGWGGRNEKSGPMIRWREGRIVRDETPGPGGTHGPAHEFVVEIRNTEHPITKGLPTRWMHAIDELYSKLRGPAKNLTVLATAFADPAKKGTGEHEPMLMTLTYGKGRIFHDALGHGPKSMVDVGFIVTLQRGTEWAATGKVTLPLPKPEDMSAERVMARTPPGKAASLPDSRDKTTNEVKPAKPNVVVILMDDMGYGDIGPFGSKLNRTPHLDRLAAEGMKLTSFYAAPLCTASRSQLMTGCYAKRVGMPDVLFPVNKTGINPYEKTIADLVKPCGYATMMIGKWHLGDQPEFLPTRHGFDHYLGLPYSNDMDGATKPGGKNPMPPLPLLRDEKVIAAPATQDKLTEVYTGEAVKFITANKDQPFFLYLAHTAVHVPLHPGAAFKGKSKNGDYGDWVEEADWSVGRVIDTLRELKLDGKTLVIFASDNGGTKNAYNGPLRGTKFTTWEGGVRVPAIVRWPGKIAVGSTCDAMLSEMDLLPTVVNLVGGKVPTDRKIDGLDIWPVLTGQSKESPHDALYFWHSGGLEAVRSGPWKLAIAAQEDKALKKSIDASRQVPRLYNLDRDMGETTDVAAQHPDVVNRLQALVATMDADLGIEKGKNGRGPGVRPAGHVDNPKPLLMRSKAEYD